MNKTVSSQATLLIAVATALFVGCSNSGGTIKTRGTDGSRSVQVNSVDMALIYMQPGAFLMGSPANQLGRQEDETQHTVILTRPFYLGRMPVTQRQWQAVMGKNPSRFSGDDLPVEQVSWDDACAFCRKLSKREGRCYRLPTEAEWEYACRAGTTSAFYSGNDDTALGLAAWYANNSGDKYIDFFQILLKRKAYMKEIEANHCRTHPVGKKISNEWGLYDMLGNVGEWCSDWYGPYGTEQVTDPTGASGNPPLAFRVLRGGGYLCNSYRCRVAWRGGTFPWVKNSAVGFRVAADVR